MVVIKTRDRGGDDLFVVLIWEDCTMGKDGKKEKMGFRKFCFLVRSERRATAHRFLLEFFFTRTLFEDIVLDHSPGSFLVNVNSC